MDERAFNYHPLSKMTVKEKLLFKLSISQSLWVLGGVFIAVKMADIVPPLPFSFPYAQIHYMIPLGICCVFAFVNHKSGLSLIQYGWSYILYKLRKGVKINRYFK